MNPPRPPPKTDAERRRRAEEILDEALPKGIAFVTIRTGDEVDDRPARRRSASGARAGAQRAPAHRGPIARIQALLPRPMRRGRAQRVNTGRAGRGDMAAYSVLVRIAEEDAGNAVSSICAAYRGAVPVPVRVGSPLYKFQVSAHTTLNEVVARLSEIRGVRVVSMQPGQSGLAASLRRHWRWLCVAAAWAALFAASVVTPDNPLEHLSSLQEILLHSAMAIAIAAWAYRSGRKGAQGLSRHASAAVLAAQEAAERAKRAARD